MSYAIQELDLTVLAFEFIGIGIDCSADIGLEQKISRSEVTFRSSKFTCAVLEFARGLVDDSDV